jgi:hypothetical protein
MVGARIREADVDAQWWITQLQVVARLNPSLGGDRYTIGDELAKASAVDRRGAFEVVKLLIAAHGKNDLAYYDLMHEAVPTVLARVIRSGDSKLQADAQEYMNLLGEQGHIELEAQVDAVSLID